jgi:predicted transcriptional regulator
MLEFLHEAAKQVPALTVLSFIVVIFLRFLEKRDKLFSETLKETDKERNINHNDLTKQLKEIVSENSKVIKFNTDIIGQTKHALEHALDRIK